MIKKYQKIYELLKHKDIGTGFEHIDNIENIYVFIYKKDIFIFDYSDDDFVKKVDSLRAYIGLSEKYMISDFDGAIEFFELWFRDSISILTGSFHINAFRSDIPKDKVYLELYHRNYLDLRLSEKTKKIFNYFNGLEYIVFDKEVIKREESSYIKKIPNEVYHGTNMVYIDSILKSGIIPKPEHSIWGVKHKKYVFITSSENTARRYSKLTMINQKYGIDNNKPVIVVIDGAKLDLTKIEYDYDFYNQYVGKGIDSYDDMRPDNVDDTLHDKKLVGKNKGLLYKKAAYTAIIKNTWIKGYYINVEERQYEWKFIENPNYVKGS